MAAVAVSCQAGIARFTHCYCYPPFYFQFCPWAPESTETAQRAPSLIEVTISTISLVVVDTRTFFVVQAAPVAGGPAAPDGAVQVAGDGGRSLCHQLQVLLGAGGIRSGTRDMGRRAVRAQLQGW